MTSGISLESFQAFLNHNLSAVHHLRLVDVAYAFGAFYAVLKVFQITRRRLKTTSLRGPSDPSLLWGVGKALLSSPDPGEMYEKWTEEYGGVYEIPLALGRRCVILCDPKAITHFFGGETRTYVLTPLGEIGTENLVSGDLRKKLMIVTRADQGCTGGQGKHIVRKRRRSP